ncbi:hypothetical protein [Planktotalea sp.]|uniref:hypothetical protein n=1 Tax=Planktotalea sp. TaxID=2029877 RepID=UPI003299DFFE
MTDKATRLLDFVLLITACALAGAALFFVAGQFDIVPELSDSAYYIINTTTPQFIDNQLTMFGPLWYSFFGPLPFITSRFLHLAILFVSGAFFSWRCAQLISGQPHSLKHLTAALFGGTFVLFYFCWGLFEPSYNSLVIVFYMGTVLCALPFMPTRPNAPALARRPFIAYAIGFGAFLTFVALIKITAAALMTVFFVLLFVVVQIIARGRSLGFKTLVWELWDIFRWSLLGVLIPILLIWVRLFDPIELFRHLANGYHSTELLGGHSFSLSDLFTKYVEYVGALRDALIDHPLFILLVAVPFVMQNKRLRANKHAGLLMGLALAVILTCGALLIKGAFAGNRAELFGFVALLRTSAFLLGVGALLHLGHGKTSPLWVIGACMVFGAFLVSAGTTNGWVWQFGIYSCFALIFMTVAVLFSSMRRQVLYVPTAAVLIGLTVIGFYNGIESQPYRMNARLSEAQTAVSYGPTQIPMRASDALADTYLALQSVTPDWGPDDKPPVFIDLSGRAPGIGLHLGLRPPKMAWILGGYPGSDAYFDFALSLLPAEDISQAWVLMIDPDGDPYKKSLSQELLNSYLETGSGRSFPQDYTAIADVPIAYIKRNAILYKPKE